MTDRWNSQMALTVCVLAGISLAVLVGATGAGEPPAQAKIDYQLFLATDTLGFFYDGQQSSVALTSLPADTDSTRLPVRADIILFCGQDTITVHPSDQPITILLTSPLDTILEVILYDRDKLVVLREYPNFDDSWTADLPRFSYGEAADSNLTVLRQTFNLDSVAGSGNEISRLLNLLKWAHQIVRHDGNSTNPSPANALNVISVCKTENRGVNCRMMATILNEVCLAMDFKSRHLTCFPEDRNDSDCHVVDMVWSKTLGKWIYLDPSFQAYFMAQDSTLLGPAEIRRKMIAGEELLINDDINWNGQPHSKKQYFNYLAKNLFRFCCPVGSEFGYESKKDNRDWVYLDPVGFNSAAIQDSTRIPVKHETHNAAYFWAAPDQP